MAKIAVKRDPEKWDKAVKKARAKMGKHSARAMQLAVKIYKDDDGTFAGPKKETSLSNWTKQKWKYSGKDKPGQGGSGVYLPEKKIARLKSSAAGRLKLKKAEAAKARATRQGKQYSRHGLAAGTSKA